ncbi:MAG: hypothetical protein IKO49_04840 [Bacilli bacterium]|nr:hypothetical protein [Bacilli bacterium]
MGKKFGDIVIDTKNVGRFYIPNCKQLHEAILEFQQNINIFTNIHYYVYTAANGDGGGDLGANFLVDGKNYMGDKLDELTEEYFSNYQGILDASYDYIDAVARSVRGEICDEKLSIINSKINSLTKDCTHTRTIMTGPYKSYETYIDYGDKEGYYNSLISDRDLIEAAKNGEKD